MTNAEIATATPAADKYAHREGFTVKEWRTDVIPMGHAQFYEEVRQGRIAIVKRGRRTYVPADQGPRYMALLKAEQATRHAAAGTPEAA
jgi:hypothetical protein